MEASNTVYIYQTANVLQKMLQGLVFPARDGDVSGSPLQFTYLIGGENRSSLENDNEILITYLF